MKLKNPCGRDCQNRGEYCRHCEKWKEYEIERNQYYSYRLAANEFDNFCIDRYNKIYCKNLKFKKGVIK